MNILFKRGVVVFSVLTLLGTTYVGAISTARPVVISRPPVVRSTPVSKPVTKTSTPKSSTTRSTTKSSTENKTTSVTNNYYTTNKSGGFFDSFTGAFVGTWFYHTLFGNNSNNSDSSSNVNTDNATQENTDGGDTEEAFSISYWITNNLEYLKNLLFGVK